MDTEEVSSHNHFIPIFGLIGCSFLQLHQALDTCALELAYEKSLHEHNIAQESEEHRRLRVQLLLLESDKDDLLAQIAEDDDYLHRAEADQNALKERSKQMEARLKNSQGELRVKTREIETLKVYGTCWADLSAC